MVLKIPTARGEPDPPAAAEGRQGRLGEGPRERLPVRALRRGAGAGGHHQRRLAASGGAGLCGPGLDPQDASGGLRGTARRLPDVEGPGRGPGTLARPVSVLHRGRHGVGGAEERRREAPDGRDADPEDPGRPRDDQGSGTAEGGGSGGGRRGSRGGCPAVQRGCDGGAEGTAGRHGGCALHPGYGSEGGQRHRVRLEPGGRGLGPGEVRQGPAGPEYERRHGRQGGCGGSPGGVGGSGGGCEGRGLREVGKGL